MFRNTKKENMFFDKFSEVAVCIAEASEKLVEISMDFSTLEKNVKAIDEMESKCDCMVHEIYQLVHKSFITPIDREDIHMIAKHLDDILDAIEDASTRMVVFGLSEMKEEAKKMIGTIHEAAQELVALMAGLHNYKKPDAIQINIVNINKLENDCDEFFMNGLKIVFGGKMDMLEAMKWKYIFDYLEKTMDKIEDVANLVEGVVIKHG
ncbi:MAG: DUF47 family protein [Clostridia bacterium]